MLLNCRQGAQRNRTAIAASIVLTVFMVPATASVAQQPDGDEGWALARTAAVFRFVNLAKDLTKSGTVFQDCLACPQMVVIPAGRFMMGSPDSDERARSNERPQRKVGIKRPFAVSQFEVTFAEWNACIEAGACAHRPDDSGWGQGIRPVINVSWDDITNEYLPWLPSDGPVLSAADRGGMGVRRARRHDDALLVGR